MMRVLARGALCSIVAVVWACASSPVARPVAAPQARSSESPEASTGGSPPSLEEALQRTPTDGMDLVETPEQQYARKYGRCDFRPEDSPPSPLAQHVSSDLVIDLRAPQQVRAGPGQEMPPALASVADAISRKGARVKGCMPVGTRGDNPLHGGFGPRFRLTPAQRGGIGVEREDPALNDPVVTCVERELAAVLRGAHVHSPVTLSVIFPSGLVPEDRRAIVIDKAAIRTTVQQNIAEVLDCYERALSIWPTLEGTIAIEFAISDDDGRVLDARVADDRIGNEHLACCIAARVHAWRFPPTGRRGFSIVTYPFILQQHRD